jgi:hypothetical protein
LLTHKSTDSLCHTNRTLANDNDGEQTHTLHQMGFLEAQHSPAARDGDYGDGFQCCHDIPNKVDKAIFFVFASESRCHRRKGAHGNCVDEKHEANGQVQFGVAGSPSEK